jgi:hypothetical protein
MDLTREWFYSDVSSGAQKGPVPSIVLSRLLEKGIGVSGSTLVWKVGMENWLPMKEVHTVILVQTYFVFNINVFLTIYIFYPRSPHLKKFRSFKVCNGISLTSKESSTAR